MPEFHPSFVVDENSERQSIILPYKEWLQILTLIETVDETLIIPQWQKEELDKRLLAHETTPEENTHYEDFHAQLRQSS